MTALDWSGMLSCQKRGADGVCVVVFSRSPIYAASIGIGNTGAQRMLCRLMPEVSVIMGVYNGGRFLPATLASVYAQTFTDWELVIVDNGSTDGGLAAALAAHPDPRVRVFNYAQPLTPGGALAAACREVRGRYVAVLDSDDLAVARRLEIQRAYLELRPELDLLAGGSEAIDEDGRFLWKEPFIARHDDIYALTAYVYTLRHSTVMFRREILGRVQYRGLMGISADHDFFARAAEVGTTEALGTTLCQYRVHPTNASRPTPWAATNRGLVLLLTHRRRRGLPEDLEVWHRIFNEIQARAGTTGRAYVEVARLFVREGRSDLAAFFAWEGMRAGARWSGLACYLRVVIGGLLRSRDVALTTARAWLKEPAHQLLRAGGVPDRPQF